MNRWIDESSRVWMISPQLGRTIFYLCPLLSLLLLGTYFIDERIVAQLGREDSVVEWVTFICFLAGGIAAGLCARFFFRSKQRLYGVVFLMVCLMAIFIAGEEISWGQRIFGWQTPEALAELNRQGETNLHNTPFSPFEYAPHLASAYGMVAYALTRLIPFLRKFAGKVEFLIPPFFLASVFLVPCVWLFARATNIVQFTIFTSRYNEWGELYLSAGFLFFIVLVRRRLIQPAHPKSIAETQPSVALKSS